MSSIHVEVGDHPRLSEHQHLVQRTVTYPADGAFPFIYYDYHRLKLLLGSRSFVMRPSSLGGGRILRRTLSVRLSVRPVIVFVYFFTVEPSYERTSKIEKTSVFAYGPASCMYFSARTEGRISYGHLGRTSLFSRRFTEYTVCSLY